MIEILKTPEFENDDYLIKIKDFSITPKSLNDAMYEDEYLSYKCTAFSLEQISKSQFMKFKNRPSLRNYEHIPDLRGSIYTRKALIENNVGSLKELHFKIKQMLMKKSRRAIVRIANSLNEYYDSELSFPMDTSCLNLIHYLPNNRIRLVFRASDIKNELYYDAVTIYQYLLKPIYVSFDLTIYSSTAQNIDGLNNFSRKIEKILK